MHNQSLNGSWQVRQANTQDWLPAAVPGDIHTDLMAAGKLEDPFYGDNEVRAQWVAERSWEYRHFFYPQPGLLNHEKIWLVCDGLDTLADVRLNGKILGQADNMHRTWRWEVKDRLREGENKLEILFRSPVSYVRARERVRRMRGMGMGIAGGPHLRKPISHFGWDWGPRLACVGIWQGVRLEGFSRGKLGEVRFEQTHTPGLVMLSAAVQCDLWGPEPDPIELAVPGETEAITAEASAAPAEPVLFPDPPEPGDPRASEARATVRLRITGPDRQVWLQDAPARPQSAITITLPNPQLWWPNGYGSQPLYQVELELLDGTGALLDARVYRLGLRTVELRQAEDEHGRSFTFVVNGLPIFCKGSNWIPADSFAARATPDRLEALIAAAAETHQNMLRVWGGGLYETDAFYDLCDRYGLLVWQDFPFACASYPLDDPAYAENVRREAVEAVRRLRHHASLALWCGGNEIEWLGSKLGWFKAASERETFQRFFFTDLPALVAAEDPTRPYWPGSPSSNDPFNDPNNSRVGDAHLWMVYAEYQPPKAYRQHHPRFVSEFGFQGLPPAASLAQFLPADCRTLNSPAAACHQRAFGGNPRLIWYLAQRFRLPRDLDGMAYLSQVQQAEAVRTGVEHWRRHPEQTSGTLYWQLNDCWPVISWASIDYYGRWKALQYAARRFYAPVLLSIEDQPKARRMDVWVSNDSCDAWQGHLYWTLETLAGEVIEGGNQPVTSGPQSAQCALKLDFARHNGRVNWRQVIFTAELRQNGERQSLQVAPFVAEKDMARCGSGLSAEVRQAGERLQVRVEARQLARFVEVSLEGADVTFSDNFFDLPAGRSAVVDCPLPPGWTVEQAQAALRVRGLDDVGPCDSPAATHWRGDLALLGSLFEMVRDGLIRPLLR